MQGNYRRWRRACAGADAEQRRHRRRVCSCRGAGLRGAGWWRARARCPAARRSAVDAGWAAAAQWHRLRAGSRGHGAAQLGLRLLSWACGCCCCRHSCRGGGHSGPRALLGPAQRCRLQPPQASSALVMFLDDSPERSALFMSAGGLGAVVRLLAQADLDSSSAEQLTSACAAILVNLAERSPERCRAIAGCAIPALARCLRSRRWRVVEMAAAALDIVDHNGQFSSPGIVTVLNAPGTAGIDPLWHTLLQRLTRSPLGPEVQEAAAAAASALRGGAFDSQGNPLADAPRVCANPGCGATQGLRRCAGCGVARYCGEACMRAHWRQHKPECRRLQAEQAAAAAPGGSA